MPIYKPTELISFLEELGIHPKKSLSQNFLIDGNIVRKIIETAQVIATDAVLEIGPGPGSLTEALLETGAAVYAVEKDRVLATALARLHSPIKKLEIFCEDILDFPLETCLKEGKKLKVIANLPYHITTPIITALVTKRESISHLIIMVQEEVARRMTAAPATREYSSLTLFLDFYTDANYAFKVSKNCFYPIPTVDSAIVCLKLKEPPLTHHDQEFFALTRTAFGQRRKMLRSSLQKLYPAKSIESALENCQLPVTCRPEELSLTNFLDLFKILQKN